MDNVWHKIGNTHSIENVDLLVWPGLSALLNQAREEHELMNDELNILHDLVTELYNNESCLPNIKKALKKIDKLKKAVG